MSHTPGPWKVELDDKGSPMYIVRENGEQSVVCECGDCADDVAKGWGGRQYSELVTCDSHVYGPTLQDARLIAAAPDLLETCKAIMEDLRHVCTELGPGLCHRCKVVRAIAKAEGR